VHLGQYLSVLHRSRVNLDEPDVHIDCAKFAARCAHHARTIEPFVDRYGAENTDEPERLHRALFDGTRDGPLGLLRDLHDLYLMCCECDISWTMVAGGAQGTRDPALLAVVHDLEPRTSVQMAWMRSRMKQAAPQALVVAR